MSQWKDKHDCNARDVFWWFDILEGLENFVSYNIKKSNTIEVQRLQTSRSNQPYRPATMRVLRLQVALFSPIIWNDPALHHIQKMGHSLHFVTRKSLTHSSETHPDELYAVDALQGSWPNTCDESDCLQQIDYKVTTC